MKNTGRQANATRTITGRSWVIASSPTGIPPGATIPVTPKTHIMLNRLLPTTFPTAMSRSPLSAATTLVATSGSEVPAATRVSPITSSEKPHWRASTTADPTNRSAPTTSKASPVISSTRLSRVRPGVEGTVSENSEAYSPITAGLFS